MAKIFSLLISTQLLLQTLSIQCQRPNGWCTHSGSSYTEPICDGVKTPTCDDGTNAGQIINIGDQCMDTWPHDGRAKGSTCAHLECARPPGWCTHTGAEYSLEVCDTGLIATCFDGKHVGQVRKDSNGNCVSTWPNGIKGCVKDSADAKGCPRPHGWCSHSGSKYTEPLCNGVHTPTCVDGTYSGQIIKVGESCVDTWPMGSVRDTECTVLECPRPPGWCTHVGAEFSLEVCKNGLIPTCFDGKHVGQVRKNKDGNCVSTWPHGIKGCSKDSAAAKGCPRPNGWCTHTGSKYSEPACNGVYTPTCTDTNGNVGQIMRVGESCIDTWPHDGVKDLCGALECPKPPGWCTHQGSELSLEVCNGGLIVTCFDGKHVGQLRKDSNGKCVSTWPNGMKGCTKNAAGAKGCPRPNGWCTHTGSKYSEPLCNGVHTPTCKDDHRAGQIMRVGDTCMDTWPWDSIGDNECARLECQRPPGWCTHAGAEFSLEVCDGGLIPTCYDGKHVGQVRKVNGACVSTWPNGIKGCKKDSAGSKGCPRPSGWCTHGGSKYTEQLCNGVLVPTCVDGTYSGQIMRVGESCLDTWPNGALNSNQCASLECQKPPGWCTHAGSEFSLEVCNGGLIPTCFDGKHVGQVRKNKDGNCVSTWPHGIKGCVKDAAAAKGCPRPHGWCSHSGSAYTEPQCNGVPTPTCTDTHGNVGQIVKLGDECIDTWPNGGKGANQCVSLECPRPPGWCSHAGSEFDLEICDGGVIQTCSDNNSIGQLRKVNGACVSTWPTGRKGCRAGSAGMKISKNKITNFMETHENSFEFWYINGAIAIIILVGLTGLIYFVKSIFCGSKKSKGGKYKYATVQVSESESEMDSALDTPGV